MKTIVSRREQSKVIAVAFNKLVAVCEPKGWVNYFEQYLAQIKSEEKEHRGLSGNYGTSISEAVKLFAVKRVFQFLAGDEAPDLKEYFHVQRSIYMAYALTLGDYRPELAKSFSMEEVESFLDSVDYAALMNPQFN